MEQRLTDEASKQISSSYVVDLYPIAAILTDYDQIIGRTIIVSAAKSHNAQNPYILNAASYLVEGEKIRTLDADRSDLMKMSPREALDWFVKDSSDAVNFELDGTFFRFELKHKIHESREILDSFVWLYQTGFIMSKIFENFLDGNNYKESAPVKESDLLPTFDKFSEIEKALTDSYGVSARHFVFVGSRDDVKRAPIDDREFLSEIRTEQNIELQDIVCLHEDERFVSAASVSISKRQTFTGYSPQFETYYAIIPVSHIVYRNSRVEGIMIVWSKTPLPEQCYRAAVTWTRSALTKRHAQKAEFLTDLRKRTDQEIDKLSHGHSVGRAERTKIIKQVGHFVCTSLVGLTNAESASLRVLHHSKRECVQYALRASAMGDYTCSGGAPVIKLDDWETSAVAFSYRDPNAKQTVLDIGDVENIADEYADAGLTSILHCRKDTRSETIIKLYRGNLMGGTLNVESPIRFAFRHDRSFFEDVSAILTNFLSRLEIFADRVALVAVANTQIAIHQVKAIIENWDGSDANVAHDVATRLKNSILGENTPEVLDAIHFGDERVEVSEDYSPLEVEGIFRRRIDASLRKIASEKTSQDILLGNFPKELPAFDMPSILVILDSIWTNIISHGNVGNNKINLEADFQSGLHNRLFTIEWISPNRLPEDTIDRDLLFLDRRAVKGGTHFGFLFMGIHARLLGGHAELVDPEDGRGFEVRIFIPYSGTAT